MLDPAALHVDLQRQQQREEELVLLVQTPRCVLVHLKGHELYDVGDAFAGDRALGGPVPSTKRNTTVIVSSNSHLISHFA